MLCQPLKDVTVGPLLTPLGIFGGTQKCGTRVHALVADETGVAGDHLLDIARGAMTKLATTL